MTPLSAAPLADRIRAASADAPLRIVGAGTWLHGGGPWADATPLPVGELRGVVEYTPGDLVVTAHAGTTLAELSAITAEHGQMLALTPYGAAHATVGAMVATASPSPLAFGDYTVRDLVLGLEVVTGTGDITRTGGRVVKNVAGFDLVRLHTGAYGTLGVITEVSLRLHARPAVDEYVACLVSDGSYDAGAVSLDDLLPKLISQRAPLPMLLVSTPNEAPQLLARLSGNTARAAALRAQLRGLGVASPHEITAEQVERTVRHTANDAVVLRARTYRSDAVPFVRAARDAFPQATLCYDPAHGSLRVVLPYSAAPSLERDIATWYRLAAANGAMHTISVVVDQGRTLATPMATPRSPLEAGIKAALDPHDVLNRLASISTAHLALADA